ncbi:MAG: peptide-methionine (S)-S-oxide reductase MsrA [Wohlfahrtiimonas sp.]
MERAIFAGGCFWCMVHPFDELAGIESVLSGYTGGFTQNPTYQDVCSGQTGHTEAVEILFNPELIDYKTLLAIYWQQVDPTDALGQFQDRGDTYRPVIFYTSEAQKIQAEESKRSLQLSRKFKKSIAVTIEPAQEFYVAEEYHQVFYRKRPERYALTSALRSHYLKDIWLK